MTGDLRALYLEAYSRLMEGVVWPLRRAGRPVSDPLLMDPDAHGYAGSTSRLLIVGQETFGWGDDLTTEHSPVPGVDSSLARYRSFEVGANYLRSPFWVAARWFQRELNPAAPPSAFAWTNLCKVDEARRRPPVAVQRLVVERFDVLREELRLTEPAVALFLTGPYYDELLRAQLPDVRFRTVEDWPGRVLVRLEHPQLPERSFRTYHPGYLQRAHLGDVLLEVRDLAL